MEVVALHVAQSSRDNSEMHAELEIIDHRASLSRLDMLSPSIECGEGLAIVSLMPLAVNVQTVANTCDKSLRSLLGQSVALAHYASNRGNAIFAHSLNQER